MSKYENLGEFLKSQKNSAISMTFAEVERVIGHKLPRSARYPAWWSNNPSNNVMTKIWLEAGFKTEQVDIEGRKLVFRRAVSQTFPAQASNHTNMKPGASSAPSAEARIHPAFGSMKGLVQIAPGVDLTEPADPEWGKVHE